MFRAFPPTIPVLGASKNALRMATLLRPSAEDAVTPSPRNPPFAPLIKGWGIGSVSGADLRWLFDAASPGIIIIMMLHVTAEAVAGGRGEQRLKGRVIMAEIGRISVGEARGKVQSKAALLVCAYADEAKWKAAQLEGAIPLSNLEARAATLPKDQEMIFYCA
jgi:hypothetical protein